MGYGESEANNAGMYKTDRGYSFYPPNDEEEENDMAVVALERKVRGLDGLSRQFLIEYGYAPAPDQKVIVIENVVYRIREEEA